MNDSLYNNPFVNNALKSMSAEQVKDYRKIGEKLFNSVDFKNNKIINDIPPPTEEVVAYIEEGLKAGLLPQDLDENEINVLCDAYGEEWYLKYGFSREEVPESGLSFATKKQIEEFVNNKISQKKKKKNKKKK
jgi:hypothetical protein